MATTSVLETWRDEPQLERCSASVLRGRPDDLLDTAARDTTGWCLVNYEGLGVRRREPVNITGRTPPEPSAFVTEIKWNVVILDESVSIKNPRANVTRIVNRYLQCSAHRCIMSGLPNPESPLDFFEQFFFVFGSFLGCSSYWQFRSRYFFVHGGHEWCPRPGAMEKIRAEVSRLGHVLQRTDVKLANQLVLETRHVTLPARCREIYKQAMTEYVFCEEKLYFPIQVYHWLTRLTGGIFLPEEARHREKLTEVASLLTGELVGIPVVVWFVYRAEGQAVSSELRKRGIRCERIDGGVNILKRSRILAGFRKGKFPVLLMQVKCGKYGINLSHADTAIYFSMPSSHNDYAQSVMRIEHPDKKQPLLILDIAAKGTVDIDLVKALRRKRLRTQLGLRNLVRELKQSWDVSLLQ